jgi:prophage regulatory protein
MNKKLIKLRSVISLTCLSRSHVYALAQQNNFPKPVKLSERSSAWVESEVLAWIDARIVLRDEEAA